MATAHDSDRVYHRPIVVRDTVRVRASTVRVISMANPDRGTTKDSLTQGTANAPTTTTAKTTQASTARARINRPTSTSCRAAHRANLRSRRCQPSTGSSNRSAGDVLSTPATVST